MQAGVGLDCFSGACGQTDEVIAVAGVGLEGSIKGRVYLLEPPETRLGFPADEVVAVGGGAVEGACEAHAGALLRRVCNRGVKLEREGKRR